MRKAFTLIELIMSIVILSIMMLFLYKSYSSLNRSNRVLLDETKLIEKKELLKKTLYLDFTLASSVTILNEGKKEDMVFLQSRNSVHKRFNPYIAYLFKEKKLYRLESLKPIKEYPLVSDSEFVVDELGEVEIFRVYKSTNMKKNIYLVHILFKKDDEILLKVKALNIKPPKKSIKKPKPK